MLAAVFAMMSLLVYPLYRPPCPQGGDGSVRARAWATVLQIRDESVRSLEWRDVVTVHRPDGGTLPMFEYTVRADELTNLRVIGKGYTLGSDGQLTSRALIFNLVDGVTRALNPTSKSAVVRPEKPDLVIPWCVPSPLVGLGRFLNLEELRSRADHLRTCPDLRVTSEDANQVTLTGTGPFDTRPFRYEIEIDPHTGDAQVMRLFDPKWTNKHPFVEWRMPKWSVDGEVHIPLRVEYRVFRVNPPGDIVQALARERETAGITPEAMIYGHPEFSKWESLRDAFLAGRYDQTVLSTWWQSSDIEIIGFNQAAHLSFELPPEQREVQLITSSALDCTVDQLDLEPSGSRLNPDVERAGQK